MFDLITKRINDFIIGVNYPINAACFSFPAAATLLCFCNNVLFLSQRLLVKFLVFCCPLVTKNSTSCMCFFLSSIHHLPCKFLHLQPQFPSHVRLLSWLMSLKTMCTTGSLNKTGNVTRVGMCDCLVKSGFYTSFDRRNHRY